MALALMTEAPRVWQIEPLLAFFWLRGGPFTLFPLQSSSAEAPGADHRRKGNPALRGQQTAKQGSNTLLGMGCWPQNLG